MDKKRKRQSVRMRMIALLLMITVFLQMTGLDVFATSVERVGNSVTRLEWLKALTETFEFTVAEDNYPDNYYSDVTSDSADYYDIMLATEFGLVDVKAGEALRPNDAATREFAAHTLNLCLGYVLEEEAYTFSEAEEVTYPEDIQIAVNQGWFALSNGKFLPDQAVTQTEKENMLLAAAEIIAKDKSELESNTYTFRDEVIVLPEDTEIHALEEDKLVITDCPAIIHAGDIFGKVCNGIPLAWKAVEVEISGNETIITTDMVNSEEAFTEIDVNREMNVDLAMLEPASKDASFHYIVGGTEEEAYEDGIVCEDLEEVGEREITAVIVEQTVSVPKTNKNFNVGNAKVKMDAKIMNLTQKHGYKLGSAYIDFSFKVDFNCNVSVDFLEAAGISPSYELFYAEILPGVYVKGVVDLSFYGSADVRLVEDVTLGFHYENFTPRLTRQFKKDSFTITANATLDTGIRMEAGFKVPGLNGKIFGKMGANTTVQSKHYTDGQKPDSCQTISSYFYASVGYDVSVDVVLYKGTLAAGNKDIYTRYNSPVRVAYHYEDGKVVSRCTRGTLGMGYGGWGYFSPVNSQYYYIGNSSSGTYDSGDVYTIFNYSLNGENQATITGYQGTAVNVFIPETLDGYPVVGIASNAFKNNKKIKYVSIADSVKTIGSSAFYGCTALERVTLPENEGFEIVNSSTFYGCTKLREIEIPDSVLEIEGWAFRNCEELSNVILSKNLVTMGGGAFEDCDKILTIEIPRSLKNCNGTIGTFKNCDALRNVIFENGITEIVGHLFYECTGLEKISIPDTVTIIEIGAFWGCTNLRQVILSENITRIESWAFHNCKKLERVEIPDSVIEIGGYAFKDCEDLSEVILSKKLETMEVGVFENCNKIINIKIPKSLKNCSGNGGPFGDCAGLKKVEFENGTTEIASFLFSNCIGLEEVAIPNTVKIIEQGAFRSCTNLQQVVFSESLKKIEAWTFWGCTKLEEIRIPDSVTEIGNRAFCECTSDRSHNSRQRNKPRHIHIQWMYKLGESTYFNYTEKHCFPHVLQLHQPIRDQSPGYPDRNQRQCFLQL